MLSRRLNKAAKTKVPEPPNPQMLEAVNLHASSWMKRGIALLNESTPASLAQALQCFDRAIELRRDLPITKNHTYRYGLAAGWMNRGDALTRIAGADNLVEALNSYAQGIALMRRLPLDENPLYRRRMAIAWLNRGITLQAQATPASLGESKQSFAESIAVLRAAASLTEADDRRLLACALMNFGNMALRCAGPAAAIEAKASAQEAIRLLAGIEESDVNAAEAGFKARHVICEAIAHLLADRNAPRRDELVHEATDAADEGMKLARHWEQRGVNGFRPLTYDLFQFGSRVYQAHQPHFLADFLLENLDPAHAPGAMPDSHELHATAVNALQRAVGDVQVSSFKAINTPRYEEILQHLRDLRTTEERLAELRRRYLKN